MFSTTFILLISFLLDIQESVPFKNSEEFELKLDYQFRQRASTSPNHVDLTETRREYEKRTSSSGPLPFLILNLKILKTNPDEFRVKVQNNASLQLLNKKIQNNMLLKLEMGFTDDLKDRTAPYEYTVLFLSQEKKEVRKIVILVDEEANFLVNGERRGKL